MTEYRRKNGLFLPRTGQETSYRTGDDGDLQAGWPGATRFVLGSDNNVVFDRATGLTWVADPALIIPGQSGKVLSGEGAWADSTAYAFGDKVSDSAIHSGTCTGGAYASNATPVTANTGGFTAADVGRYLVITGVGTFRVIEYTDATHAIVSGNASAAAGAAFAALGYYVCIAAHTGDGIGTNRPSADAAHWVKTTWTASDTTLSAPVIVPWNTAIDDCLALDYAGFTDWYLPNYTELLSIADAEETSPCIDAAIFAAKLDAAYYWTGSTRKDSSANAFQVYFAGYPIVMPGDKTVARYARPVRGGFLNG